MTLQTENQKKFQILALSGGGFRGLYTAQVLADLEERSGTPIAKHFDLIAGTSIGGIIAIAAALEIPMKEVVNLFVEHGQTIFKKRPFYSHWFSITKSPYDSNNLKSLLEKSNLFGEFKIADLKHPVIIPTINYTKGAPQVFKTPHHKDFERDHVHSLVDVALATSAAPAYFQRHCFNDWQFVDGGLCANNPALLAVHEADYFFNEELSQISLLSIGTLSAKRTVNTAGNRDGGAIDWAESNFSLFNLKGFGLNLTDFPKNIIDLTLSNQQLMMEQMAIHRLKKHGGLHIKIDENLTANSATHIGLDQVTKEACETLRGNARLSTQSAIKIAGFESFFEHIATAPKWFHGPYKNA